MTPSEMPERESDVPSEPSEQKPSEKHPLTQQHYDYAFGVATSILHSSLVPVSDGEDIAIEATERALRRLSMDYRPDRGRWQTFLYSLTQVETRRALWRFRRRQHQIDPDLIPQYPESIDMPTLKSILDDPVLIKIAVLRMAGHTWEQIQHRLKMSRRRLDAEAIRIRHLIHGSAPPPPP